MRQLIAINFLLAGIVTLTACGGGGSSTPQTEITTDTTTTTTDTTTTTTDTKVNPPAASTLVVSSTSPLDSSTQKSDFPIAAIFSEPVDETTIDSSSFGVTAGVNPVTGVFSFSEDRTMVIFTPDTDLLDGVTYTVSINTDVASAAGEVFTPAKSWSFIASDKTNYSCTLTSPPIALGLDAYYTQYCDANGMPVIGGSLVSPAALQIAWLQTMNMMKLRQDLLAEMIKQGTKVAIVAEGEGITQIPEYSDLDTVFPIDGGWDARARGLGATPARPISSGAEENLFCYLSDPYLGENIFIHEFAHSVEGMGIFFAEPAVSGKIQTAYDNALANGLYANTYADDTVYEYWAEGVQNWFNVNLEAIPSDGIHNEINTRAELKTYDPALYNIISTVFPADWQPTCP